MKRLRQRFDDWKFYLAERKKGKPSKTELIETLESARQTVAADIRSYTLRNVSSWIEPLCRGDAIEAVWSRKATLSREAVEKIKGEPLGRNTHLYYICQGDVRVVHYGYLDKHGNFAVLSLTLLRKPDKCSSGCLPIGRYQVKEAVGRIVSAEELLELIDSRPIDVMGRLKTVQGRSALKKLEQANLLHERYSALDLLIRSIKVRSAL